MSPPDHRAVLAAIRPEQRAALAQRADAPGLARLLAHLGLILGVGALIAVRVPLWPLLLPVQGVLVVFLFTLAHEATHRTPFATGWLNEAAGHLAGAAILLPFRWFRAFHLAHHRFTNLPGDPELEGGKPESLRAWAWHVSGLPYWRSQAALLVRLARGRERPPWLPEGQRPAAEREARVLLALYGLAAASLLWTPLLFWVWLLPALLGQPALRLYLLAEHGDCPQVADMLDSTRTTFTNRVVRFLAWNMPYHAEHHMAPWVPFHRLPALHALVRGALRQTAPGYAAFTRAYLARRWR